MTPAQIAAAEFQRRRAWLSRQVAGRHEQPGAANVKLLPWLHIAAMAGAQIDAVYEDAVTIFPFDQGGKVVKSPIVLTLTNDERTTALQTLARARDAAVDAVPDPSHETFARLSAAAHGLQNLAAYLGAPPYRCPSLSAEKEAA